MLNHDHRIRSFASVEGARSLASILAIAVVFLLAKGEASQTLKFESVEQAALSSLMYGVRRSTDGAAPVAVSTLTIPPQNFFFKLVLPRTSEDGSSLVG